MDFEPFPSGKFEVIYADPPWDYGGRKQHNRLGETSGSVDHYPSIKREDLMKLPVKELADKDCLLFMWSTGPLLDEAVDLGRHWGFAYRTIAFVWNKCRSVVGYYTLSENEVCLVFKRGNIPTPRGANNIKQTITAPRSFHSRKPDEVRDSITAMFPYQRKVELFARRGDEIKVKFPAQKLLNGLSDREFANWEFWGNQS